MLYDQFGNVLKAAGFVPSTNKAEPVTIASETSLPVPELVTQTKGKGKSSIAKVMNWIDALPGGRNNFITVLVPNPKQANTIASRNWPLYGEQGKPTVTVAEFIRAYPPMDGGTVRATTSLAWDIGHGFIRIGTGAEGTAQPEQPIVKEAKRAAIDWSKMKA